LYHPDEYSLSRKKVAALLFDACANPGSYFAKFDKTKASIPVVACGHNLQLVLTYCPVVNLWRQHADSLTSEPYGKLFVLSATKSYPYLVARQHHAQQSAFILTNHRFLPPNAHK
jgi:hypothetical protein